MKHGGGTNDVGNHMDRAKSAAGSGMAAASAGGVWIGARSIRRVVVFNVIDDTNVRRCVTKEFQQRPVFSRPQLASERKHVANALNSSARRQAAFRHCFLNASFVFRGFRRNERFEFLGLRLLYARGLGIYFGNGDGISGSFSLRGCARVFTSGRLRAVLRVCTLLGVWRLPA